MSLQKDLIVCLSYARSGGTMLSQVLGYHPSVLLFSEVNPKLNAVSSIKDQAKNWYEIELKEDGFEKSIEELLNLPELGDRQIIIRDFSFIDFTPHELNQYKPLGNFGSVNALSGKYNLKPFAFVRDAFDIWISRDCPPEFSEHYLNYVHELKRLRIKTFKYEDFCDKPLDELKKIYDYLGVEFKPESLEGIECNAHTTGDVDLKNSRGRNKRGGVQRLKRKQLPENLKRKANSDRHLMAANLLLGYGNNINKAEFEKASKIKTELKWLYRKVLKKYPSAKY